MEKWRDAPGYEGTYTVSDLGRVRIKVRRHNIHPGTILAQTPARDDYLQVTLRRNHELRGKHFAIGRLVLLTFVGPPPKKGMEANHKNGDITDNRLENLDWMTKAENIRHSIEELGSTRAGEKNPAAKLTEKLVTELRERAASGESYKTLSEDYGVTPEMVGQIARGKAWAHVGGPRISGRPVGRPPSCDS